MRGILGVVVLVITFLLASCGGYQRVLKSSDLSYKERMGRKYYDKGQYAKAMPIFDELLTLYRGSPRSEEIYYLFAKTHFGMNDYILAGYHFKNFIRTFPNSRFEEESYYMVGYCYYLEAPEYSLDQSYTYKAINELQLFVNTHPQSKYVENANQLMRELRQRLEIKAYKVAMQYYHMEQYQSASVAFDNLLNDFPDTQYREEVMYYHLDAAYRLARNSVEEKKTQRYREAKTSYDLLTEIFPDSQYRKQAERIKESIDTYFQSLSISNKAS
jgi:outer membrane protein assembly factor BamD